MSSDRPASAGTDVAALASALARDVRGAVRFDAGSRALYATDASNYRQVPIGVVVPESIDDVAAAVAVCRRFGAPVLTRGAGTSLAGQCCNAAVVLDFSRHLRRVLEVDPARRLARVEPGAVLDDLRREAERHGLTFGPDPATHAYCTLGGMIGNDSCGVHSVLARFEGEGGRTADNVAALDVLTSDGARLRVGATSEGELREIVAGGGRRGEIYGALAALRDRHAAAIRARFPAIPRRVSGYNLPALLPENGFHVARALVGSEGTCATVLEATLHLIPSPPARVLLVAAYPDVFAAADVVPQVLAHRPAGLEGLDDGLVADARSAGLSLEGLALLPEGGGWLLVELGAESTEAAAAKARMLEEDLLRGRPAPRTRVFTELAQQRRVWAVRESGLPATAHPAGRPLTWEGWEDSAVAPEKLGAYLRDLRRLWESHGYRGDLYGHFGDGCVHTRLDFDLESKAGIARFRAFVGEAADLVLSYGGSLSGEHGDGQARAELLPKMFGPELVEAFREFKRIWDPDGLMNPGKVVDPNPIVANLRLEGGLPGPPGGATVFRFPQDGGSLARATLRCVGVGKCRRDDGDTMCPSFRATGEERHSTRGRARLLFEMLRGEVVRGGWESAEVKEALDLCLSCKACRSECPVGVDMAAYKAEFLHHYYAARRRPRSARIFGSIHRWARAGSRAPRLANFLTGTPGLSRIAKAFAGMAPEREIPRLARGTFRDWSRSRAAPTPAAGSPSRRVLLFPDTFTDAFAPEIARDSVQVLEAAGFTVEVPEGDLCCGRPLYDSGRLPEAQHLLRGVLDALREPLGLGLPVVVLEPSCAAVFRDELGQLFPDDADAVRLAQQTHLLAGFLLREAPGLLTGRLSGRALAQPHCHQRALFGMSDDEALLAGSGLEVEILDAGCCGMAGAFGFERGEHYEISRRCAERRLLPEIRAASNETRIIADGFSCREQIRQLSGRRPLHLAQILRQGLS